MLSVGHIDVIMAKLGEAVSSRSVAVLVAVFNNVLYVTVLDLLVISVVKTQWVLMPYVQECGILVQEETAATSWLQSYGSLLDSVVLHVVYLVWVTG